MQKQKQGRRKYLLYYTLRFLTLQRRLARARKKLVRSIKRTSRKQELETLLHFGQFLSHEASVQEAYRKRIKELEQEPFQTYFTTTKNN